MKTTSIAIIGSATAFILSIPLIAMQFTDEVDWTLSDFLFMGVILFVTGTAIDFIWRKLGKYKIFAVAGIIFLFLWLYAELAVGIFTNWGS